MSSEGKAETPGSAPDDATASKETKSEQPDTAAQGSGSGQASAQEPAPTQEEVVMTFNRLRQEQRTCSNKISELTEDMKEHKLVISTLEGVEGDRKCFRLIGGVLVERKVKEVLPALVKNVQMIEKTLVQLQELLVKKGVQLNAHREKYNIRVQGEGGGAQAAKGGSAPSGGADPRPQGEGDVQGNPGVLVAD